MTRKNSPKKGQVVLICPCAFMCEKNIDFAQARMYV